MRHFLFPTAYIRPFSTDSLGAPVRLFDLAQHFASSPQAWSMISAWDRTCRRGRRRSVLRRRCHLLRHQALPFAVSPLACRVGQSPLFARLVALARLAHGLAARLLRAVADAIDLAAVTAAADQHQGTASLAQEQPARYFHRRGAVCAWTASARFATAAVHTCTTRCEGTVPSPLGSWSAPCLPFQAVVTAPSALMHAACTRRASISLL
jgi:hypothetical protein